MDDSVVQLDELFQEPSGYYQDEKPHTFAKYRTHKGEELKLRLVGQSPLWGHLLWNAGQTIAEFLEDHSTEFIQDRYVLEFGAGSGLPSIISALYNAAGVVITDYPDQELIQNIKFNVDHCCSPEARENVSVEGFIWGSDVARLNSHLPEKESTQGFHTLILADLLFNHSEHHKLAKSIVDTLRRGKDSCALVFFTPYRPWLLDKDMDFFTEAKHLGLHVEKLLEIEMEKLLFDSDPGDEKLRRTVYGYKLTWPDD